MHREKRNLELTDSCRAAGSIQTGSLFLLLQGAILYAVELEVERRGPVVWDLLEKDRT